MYVTLNDIFNKIISSGKSLSSIAMEGADALTRILFLFFNIRSSGVRFTDEVPHLQFTCRPGSMAWKLMSPSA